MLTSVMHGMKFLNFLSGAKSLNNQEKDDEHPSILQNPKNREYLAKQGFYDKHIKKSKTEPDFKSGKLSKSQSMDASEKRKRWISDTTKSRNYSSLGNVPEQEEVFDSRRNFTSLGASFETARTSGTSFDYGRSMTSMETSTDSFDSGDSGGSKRRHGARGSDVFLESPQQSNIADSGIWNTQDSTKSMEEEYLAEFSRESAKQRKSQVTRMMSGDNYVVGDDADILKSPPLSRTGSLETTLTSSGFHKLDKKSSTLKDSFEDDLEMYSESYLSDKDLGRSQNKQIGADQLDHVERSRSAKCLTQQRVSRQRPDSHWKTPQRFYGVEMSVRVPGNKLEADFTNNNCNGGMNLNSEVSKMFLYNTVNSEINVMLLLLRSILLD